MMHPASILVVEPDEPLRQSIVEELEHHYQVRAVATASEARAAFSGSRADLVVLDCELVAGALGLIEHFRKGDEAEVVVLVTALGSDVATACQNAGAYDQVNKPVDLTDLDMVIERTLEHHALRREIARLKRTDPRRQGTNMLLGVSDAIELVRDQIRQVAGSPDTTVLIRGESGTGKELVAEAIHLESARRDGPLVRMGCSSIPADRIESELFGIQSRDGTMRRGLVQQADHGTLLLDEIGDLPLELQPKLLRVLEGRGVRPLGGDEELEVDVRFVAATARELESMAEQGLFRTELLFRIRVFEIVLPALRERAQDIDVLTEHFLLQFRVRLGKPSLSLTSRAQRALRSYDWPGNIRELRNIVERAVILAKGADIDVQDLSLGGAMNEQAEAAIIPLTLAEAEKQHILQVYRQTGHNKSRTAKLLEISRSTLREKLKLYSAD